MEKSTGIVIWILQWIVLYTGISHTQTVTPAHNEQVCSTWGNYHFKTFDGDIFQLPSTCNYILTAMCGSSYEDFNIQMRRHVVRDQPTISDITMKLDGTVVELTNSSVSVDGQQVTLPFSHSGVLIENSSTYIKITAKIGLVAMWNGHDSFMVELDKKYQNKTCGLCGDFNGIQLYNEFIQNGVEISPNDYAHFAKMDGPTESCTEQISSTEQTCEKLTSVCEQLLSGPSFSSCTDLVPLDSFIKACEMDMCQCSNKSRSFCLCSSISEFSRQCVHAGGKPDVWRTEQFCGKSCPHHSMVHQECGNPCINTCSNPDRGHICEDHCIDGCFCPEGFVFDDLTDRGCIAKDQCSCVHNGEMYQSGQTYRSSCKECTCVGGHWSCIEKDCPGTCSVEGGSHIITYDGRTYSFHGDCTYVLTKQTDFAVLGDLMKCGLTDTETCLKAVTLFLSEGNTFFTIQSDGKVFVNRIFSQLPLSTAGVMIFKPTTFFIIVQTSFGLQLEIQLVPIMQLYIKADVSHQQKTIGLCGNFNSIQADDFITVSGSLEGTAAGFANGWKTRANCPDVQSNFEDPCSLSLDNERYAQKWCSLLSDPNGVFASCHKEISPDVYQKTCIYDTCNCEKSEDCMCAALSAYVHACAAKGIFLHDWRNATCGTFSASCPSTMVYSYRVQNNSRSCRCHSDPDFTCGVTFEPVDGCVCAEGTYLDEEGKCVSPDSCSCYIKGTVIPPGEVINKDGTMCTCKGGKLGCIGQRNSQPSCNKPMEFFNCTSAAPGSTGSECQKSCNTVEMACISTECVSGCMCPSELVSDGRGGCIEEDLCPCIHNGFAHQPGETINVDCNTCTCKDRKWQCTTNLCHGTCTVYGDGHYVTFDGKRYTFDGDCEYTLIRDFCGPTNANGTFRVLTENVPCGTTGTTCSKAVKIFLGNKELKLTEGGYEVFQRDVGEDIPYQIRIMGIYMVIEANNGLIVIWDRKTSMFVKLSPIFKGAVCGLCGNYDGNTNNDFMLRSQEVVTKALDFGNSWKESSSCPDALEIGNPCSKNPYRQSWAQKQCSIIKSEVFTTCHSQVDPSPFYDACVRDSCACDSGGDCECFCTTVAAYAQACNEAGACVAWRTPKICPLFCDYYNPPDECEWHYKSCGAPCMQTCRNPSGKCSSQIPALEGCYPKCPPEQPYFDEDTMKCVEEEWCGCYDNQGNHYNNHERVPSTENCQICFCNAMEISCEYNVTACTCTFKGNKYQYGETIYNTTDGLGNCITAVCEKDGIIKKDSYPCPTSHPTTTTHTSTTIFNFSSTSTGTDVPVTSAKYTSETTPSFKTTREVTTNEPNCTVCYWTQWMNVDYPKFGPQGGDNETIKNIISSGLYKVCENPVNVTCQAVRYPGVPLSDLHQNVICNNSGLICENKYQTQPICLDYEIRVECCEIVECPKPSVSTSTSTSATVSTTSSTTLTSVTLKPITSIPTQEPSPTTTRLSSTITSLPPTVQSSSTSTSISTTPTTTTSTTTPSTTSPTSTTPKSSTFTTTPGCVCSWSDWLDFGSATTGPEGGEVIPIDKITDTYPSLCKVPVQIECRAKLYPGLPLSQLGQVVKCNAKDGLVCLNKNQGLAQQCFDYEIRVLCCDGNCGTLPTQTPSPTTTRVSSTSMPTPPSTPSSTVQSSSTITSISTTPTTTTSTTTPSTTSPTSTTPKSSTFTTTPGCVCSWSDWLDFGSATTGPEGGEVIPIDKITDTYPFLCKVPVQIECRAKLYPGLPLSQLGQVVKCNAKDGLVCLNNLQGITQQCFDYEIRILCCNGNCGISTPAPIITTKFTSIAPHSTKPTVPPDCICNWSEWMDFGGPTSGLEGGEMIPIKEIINTYPNTCSAPIEIECRAKLYPELGLSELGQEVTCNTEDGLVCLNKNQGVTKQCFDYEIRVYCCEGLCERTSTTLQTHFSSSTMSPTTTGFSVITGSTKGHSTERQDCFCEVNGEKFEPGSVIYNKTDGDGWCYIATCVKTEEMKCDVIKLSVPCLTTVSPSTSTPWTGNCDDHVPPLTNGESVNVGNCYIDTCINGTIKHEEVHCGPVEYPVCENGYSPVKVPDESGCCFKYECQCICNGFGDPHYITFDGTYYPFQGNCSYVLVKEIDPKYNFSVIIDNVFCDSGDGLSCPRSLTVYYKSFEIFMSQEISEGIVTNLIYVNQKRVNLPFQNEDFRISENGIESLVVIPEIGAQISFTGMMFSIHLPWEQFHGNTEGQCGTCDNNRTDDCRLPNGTVISSCQDMAPHWHVNNTNSVCPPPKPEPTPKPCPPPAICKIIESELFEKCHKIVPHEPFVQACNFDVCHMNETIGCSSLQAYAQECAMAGICVDWRPATDGVCDFKCKEPQVYKACGPQVEPTCDERFNLKYILKDDSFHDLDSMIWEGCYCPDGTTLLSPNSNVCVPTCEICMLPNEGWKKANDTWIMGCEMCTCEEESLTIQCDALPCPTQDPVVCDEVGQIKVTETVNCCKTTKCECDVSLCPSKNFTCPVGYSVEVTMGVCCPIYGCLPKPVCVFNNTEYKPGTVVPGDICEKCLCTDNLNTETHLHSVKCQPVECDRYCQLGFEYESVPGQCCGRCVQKSCVIVHAGNISHSIAPGEVWSPPGDKCVKFECVKIGSQFITMEAHIVCPYFNPDECVPGTEVIAPDGCCHACIVAPKNCNVSKSSTYLESNGCTSAMPVELSTCGGSCGTYSMYSSKDKVVQHSCSCCREMATSERKAQLICPDGSKVAHTYIYIEKCGCVETDCTVQQISAKRQRRRSLT